MPARKEKEKGKIGKENRIASYSSFLFPTSGGLHAWPKKQQQEKIPPRSHLEFGYLLTYLCSWIVEKKERRRGRRGWLVGWSVWYACFCQETLYTSSLYPTFFFVTPCLYSRLYHSLNPTFTSSDSPPNPKIGQKKWRTSECSVSPECGY